MFSYLVAVGEHPNHRLHDGPYSRNSCLHRHVHVSLRDKDGKNVFAVSGDEATAGRQDALYEDTKFISQEAEWFLAGILDGIADGT